jgi:YlmC/YmxH family sporulation protein
MENTLNDLRWKEVICVTDGTRYGYVDDVSIDLDTGQIRALVVPGAARFFGLFGRKEDKFFSWESVRRFGEDIILVEGVPETRLAKGRGQKFF